MEFLQVFGVVFGIVAGLGTTFAVVFKFGRVTGDLQRDVQETKAIATRTEGTVNEYGPRLQRIEQTLHGVNGENGLYSDVKELKRRVEDRPATPMRRKTDKRRAS